MRSPAQPPRDNKISHILSLSLSVCVCVSKPKSEVKWAIGFQDTFISTFTAHCVRFFGFFFFRPLAGFHFGSTSSATAESNRFLVVDHDRLSQ